MVSERLEAEIPAPREMNHSEPLATWRRVGTDAAQPWGPRTIDCPIDFRTVSRLPCVRVATTWARESERFSIFKLLIISNLNIWRREGDSSPNLRKVNK